MADYFFNADSGNDSNNGLSEATPRLTIISNTHVVGTNRLFFKTNTTNRITLNIGNGFKSSNIFAPYPSELSSGSRFKFNFLKSVSTSNNWGNFSFINCDWLLTDNNVSSGGRLDSSYWDNCLVDLSGIIANSYVFAPKLINNSIVIDSSSFNAFTGAGTATQVASYVSCTLSNWTYLAGTTNAQTYRNCIFKSSPTKTTSNTFYGNAFNCAFHFASTHSATATTMFSSTAAFINCHFIDESSNSRNITTNSSTAFEFCRYYNCSVSIGGNISTNNSISSLATEFQSTNPASADFLKPVVSGDCAGTGLGGGNIGWFSGTLVPVVAPYTAASNVRSGIDRGDGVLGTLDLPAIADVKIAVTYDGGTKTGTLESTDPGIANVRSGTNYKIQSVSKSGTMAVPVPANVRAGVSIDATVGLLDLPSIANVLLGVIFDNGTKTGTSNNTDPGVANVVSGVTYYINSVLKTGTRTAIYDLLNLYEVRIGVDRGDGSNGTYDGSDRYSDPLQTNVSIGVVYRFNSLTNNRTGTNESTDPGEDKVVLGVMYKINSVDKTGSRTETYALVPLNRLYKGYEQVAGQPGTDVGEDFNDDLSEALVEYGLEYTIRDVLKTGANLGATNNDVVDPETVIVGTTIKNLGVDVDGEYKVISSTDVREDVEFGINETGEIVIPAEINVELGTTYDISKTGSSVGAPFNDLLLPEMIVAPYQVLNRNVMVDGNAQAGSADYPSEDVVLVDVEYASGTKVGNLGRVDLNNSDMAGQLQAKAEQLIASLLGEEWKPLNYFKEVQKNNLNNNSKQWGIRPLGDVATDKLLTRIDLDFEIKLTDSYNNKGSDQDERLAELNLIAQMETIRTSLLKTRWNFATNVGIIREFDKEEVDNINETTLVCRAVITVNYRT